MPKNIIFTKESEAMDYAKDIGGELNPVDGGFTVDKVMYMHEGGGLPPHDHATSGAEDDEWTTARDALPHELDIMDREEKERLLGVYTKSAKKTKPKTERPGNNFKGVF
jgi:hypothetical protein